MDPSDHVRTPAMVLPEPVQRAFRRGDWQHTLALLDDAALPPAVAQMLRATCLRNVDQRDAAKRAANLAVELAAAGPPELLCEALCERAAFRMAAEAVPDLRRATDVADQHRLPALQAFTRVCLCIHHSRRGDVQEGEALLQDAEVLHPAVVHTEAFQRALGLLRRNQGRLGEAEEAFRQAVHLTLGDSPLMQAKARLRLGDALRRLHRPRPAMDELAKALAILDDAPPWPIVELQAYNQLGEVLRHVDRLDEAEVAYRRAVARIEGIGHPGERVARVNLALVQIERGTLGEARASLQAIEGPMSPDSVVGLVRRVALAICAVDADDGGAWEAVFPRWMPRTSLPVDMDLAALAHRAGVLAAKRGGPWLPRAVQAHAMALAQQQVLGGRDEEQRAARALRRLGDAGARPQLGPFRLLERIGEGAFGQVWRATHHDGAIAAVKVLSTANTASEQLQNELRAVAALDHPNIVRLLHHGTIDGAAAIMDPSLVAGSRWIATDFAGGGTLDDHVGLGPYPFVRRMLMGVLDGLAHAHARGLLHLDVKPANVLLSLPGPGADPLLADFGLATAVGASRERVAGTPAYMAPEQFQPGTRALGPWTDLYAVGCLAVALVSGGPPFQSTNFSELRGMHARAELEFEPCLAVPAGFESWLVRALAKDPARRFRRAADAARALMGLGGAMDGAGGGRRLQTEDLPTVVLPSMDVTLGVVSTTQGACDVPPPVVPVRWQRGGARREEVLDAGLGLFGLRRPPLVGRTLACGMLWATLRQVHADATPRAVVLEAGPGMGASALGQWLCERAHETGAATPIAVGHTGGRGTDSSPLADALVHHWRLGGLDRRGREQRLSAALPDLPDPEVALLADLVVSDGGLPPGKRRRILVRALSSMARRRPVVVFLDDAARGGDLRVLLRIALAERAPVMWVMSGRDDAAEPWVDGSQVVCVPLPPMSDADLTALIRARIRLRETLMTRVLAASDRSPRVAVQLLSHLVDADRLSLQAGPDVGWGLREGTETDLPDTPEALWRARTFRTLRGVAPGERACLVVACLLGGTVDGALWRRACDAADVPVSSLALDRLLDAGLAVRRPGGWTLVDDGLRAHLAGQVPADELQRLHGACASAHPDALAQAHHWEGAGQPARAIAALCTAIEQGTWRGDARLEQHRDRAAALLASLPVGPGRDRCALACALSDARILMGRDRGQAEGALARVRALATELDDHRTLCHAWSASCDLVGNDIEAARAALGSLAEDADPQVRTEALHRLGRMARLAGAPDEAAALLHRALEDQPDAPSIRRAWLFEDMASVDHRRSDHAAALGWYARAKSDYEALGAWMQLRTVDLGMGDVLRSQGDLDAAAERYRDAYESLDALDAAQAIIAAANLALVDWARGRDDEGDALVRELMAKRRPSPDLDTLVCLLALPQLVQGEDDEAWTQAIHTVRDGSTSIRGAQDARLCVERAIRRAGHREARAAELRALLP